MDIVLPQVYSVACHTDHVGPGSTFVAIKGMKDDGIRHIMKALQKGAASIVVDEHAQIDPSVLDEIKQYNATLIKLSNTRRALAQLSAKALDFPAKKLRIVGVTGTKGKTTTCFVLEHLFTAAGYKTALISSVYNKIDTTIFATSLTTPQPDYLHEFFDACIKAGVEVIVMEVAAQALSLDRVYGIDFDGVIFTNFDREHGEFYASLDDYFNAKCLIFDQLKPNAPIIVNADDQWCHRIIETKPGVKTFGFEDRHAFMTGAVIYDASQMLKLCLRDGLVVECPSLFGRFNAYNLFAGITLAHALGISFKQIQQSLKTFIGVPGRLQAHQLPNGARCFIDKAHNPSSYRAVLGTLRSMTDHLIVVFGAGGERDKEKRPMMGQIASELGDILILTSDDPRSEDPEIIIQEILAGITPEKRTTVFCTSDREYAIRKAYECSRSSSIIVLLGKGNDEYQMIGTTKLYFNEREILASL
jgi:UDP-N-acetylmuramoyl-L-alanyl-D-glutamate--2,6-diaminopimelate ligase